jgi:hypothetical protein
MEAAKMQWLQDPNQNHVDNLNSVKYDVCRYFRKKQRKHLKVKSKEIETNSKKKNIRDLYRGIDDKKGYQPRANIVKDENVYLIADPHSISARWRNHFLSY